MRHLVKRRLVLALQHHLRIRLPALLQCLEGLQAAPEAQVCLEGLRRLHSRPPEDCLVLRQRLSSLVLHPLLREHLVGLDRHRRLLLLWALRRQAPEIRPFPQLLTPKSTRPSICKPLAPCLRTKTNRLKNFAWKITPRATGLEALQRLPQLLALARCLAQDHLLFRRQNLQWALEMLLDRRPFNRR